MKKMHISNDFSYETKLHTNILDILFNHKKEVSSNLRDIIGLFSIEHIAIFIINPSNEISIFSSTPSVEYNLIVNNFWRYDKSFSHSHLSSGTMTWWDESYYHAYKNEIKYTKEHLHKFSLGMNLIRKIDNHTLTYSFATRSKENELKAYYYNLRKELLLIGDYAYNLIRNIYSGYSAPYSVPLLEQKKKPLVQKKHLSLIINC